MRDVFILNCKKRHFGYCWGMEDKIIRTCVKQRNDAKPWQAVIALWTSWHMLALGISFIGSFTSLTACYATVRSRLKASWNVTETELLAVQNRILKGQTCWDARVSRLLIMHSEWQHQKVRPPSIRVPPSAEMGILAERTFPLGYSTDCLCLTSTVKSKPYWTSMI